jgi:hypothetical protein
MRINLRLLFSALISLVDDIAIIALVIRGLPLFGIRIPWWLTGIPALVLVAWSSVGYWAVVKNPQMGFENMVGKAGLAVEPIKRKGLFGLVVNYGKPQVVRISNRVLKLQL